MPTSFATANAAGSPTQSFRHAHDTIRQSTNGGLHAHRSLDDHQTIALPRTNLATLNSRQTKADPLTPPPDTPSFNDEFESLNRLGLDNRECASTASSTNGVDAMRRPNMRVRGESDLGRPATRVEIPNGRPSFAAIPEIVEPNSSTRRHFSLTEITTGILIPLPYLFASLAFPVRREAVTRNTLLLEDLQDFSKNPGHITSHPKHIFDPNFPFVQTCAIASATLLLVGAMNWIGSSTRGDEKKEQTTASDVFTRFTETQTIRRLMTRVVGVALPFYGALQLGGGRAALVMLLAIAVGTPSLLSQLVAGPSASPKLAVTGRKYTLAWLALLIVSDLFGLSTSANHPHELILGYLALTISAFVLPPPLSLQGWQSRHASPSMKSTSAVPSSPYTDTPPATPQIGAGPEIRTAGAAKLSDGILSVAAGTILLVLTFALSMITRTSIKFESSTATFGALALASSAALVLFARPASLHTHGKFGVLAGCATVAFAGCMYASTSYKIPLIYAVWSATAYVTLLFDSLSTTRAARSASHAHSHDHVHAAGAHSRLTGYLLTQTEPGSIMHSILIDKSSRRIAYFASLNLGFMIVQFSYGMITGSLGLLTDSIHMLFDCAGLAVGLAASIMSKWPPSINFPYGYSKIETLSGFANGILLILVCVEIVFDAMHRLTEGAELVRLNELLIVSTLGFLVNIVGLMAFGHAHHGHDHGHDHGHAHNHSHVNEHTHSHSNGHIDEKFHNHDHTHGTSHHHTPSNGLATAPSSTHTHSHHAHSHTNENMQGIFLHVLADTLGSLSVIVSTLLTQWNGWSGWDPLASVLISILIFLTALPLVKNSAKKLLLSLPDEEAYRLREVLLGLGELKGVAGYAGVRFWGGDKMAISHGDHHNHEHSHDHGHDHTIDEKSSLSTMGGSKSAAVYGTIHVIAARSADFDDVRQRTEMYLSQHGVDAVIQMEREGGGRCWCGGGVKVGI